MVEAAAEVTIVVLATARRTTAALGLENVSKRNRAATIGALLRGLVQAAVVTKANPAPAVVATKDRAPAATKVSPVRAVTTSRLVVRTAVRRGLAVMVASVNLTDRPANRLQAASQSSPPSKQNVPRSEKAAHRRKLLLRST